MASEEKKLIPVIYAGKDSNGSKVIYRYLKLDESGKVTNSELRFSSKLHKIGAIGIQLALENPSGSSYRIAKGTVISIHSDYETIRRLRAESEAVETAMKAQSELSKGVPFESSNLKGLRNAYKGLSTSAKRALLANIIEYITR